MVAQWADGKESLKGRVFKQLPQQAVLLGNALRDNNANVIAKSGWRVLHKMVTWFA